MTRTRVIYVLGGSAYTGAMALNGLIKNCRSYGIVPPKLPGQSKWQYAAAVLQTARAAGIPLGKLMVFREPRKVKHSLYKQTLNTLNGGRLMAAPPTRRPRAREYDRGHATPRQTKRRSRVVKLLEQELTAQEF